METFSCCYVRPEQALLYKSPEEKEPSQTLRVRGGQFALMQKCQAAFVQIVLPTERIQGWARIEDLSVFLPPPRSPALKHQHLVRLDGACSSGKSSFEANVVLRDRNWTVIDDDNVSYTVWKETLSKRFPVEYGKIAEVVDDHNLYQAFTRNQISFRAGTTPEKIEESLQLFSEIRRQLDDPSDRPWRQNIWKLIGEKVVELAKEALSQGKNVIVCASSAALKKVSEEYPCSQTMSVLLYNPLPVALQRLIERNRNADETGNFREKRFPSFIPVGYCRLMTRIQDRTAACDSASRRVLCETFDRIIAMREHVRPSDKPFSFTQYDFSEEQIRGWQKELLGPEGEGDDTCHLAPKESYALILQSDKASPSKLAERFLEVFPS